MKFRLLPYPIQSPDKEETKVLVNPQLCDVVVAKLETRSGQQQDHDIGI